MKLSELTPRLSAAPYAFRKKFVAEALARPEPWRSESSRLSVKDRDYHLHLHEGDLWLDGNVTIDIVAANPNTPAEALIAMVRQVNVPMLALSDDTRDAVNLANTLSNNPRLPGKAIWLHDGVSFREPVPYT